MKNTFELDDLFLPICMSFSIIIIIIFRYWNSLIFDFLFGNYRVLTSSSLRCIWQDEVTRKDRIRMITLEKSSGGSNRRGKQKSMDVIRWFGHVDKTSEAALVQWVQVLLGQGTRKGEMKEDSKWSNHGFKLLQVVGARRCRKRVNYRLEMQRSEVSF